MQNIKYDNFVGIYDNFFSDDLCDALIQHFDWCAENNRTHGRPDKEKLKNDSAIFLNAESMQEINFRYTNLPSHISNFNDIFWDVCYADYLKKYSVLSDYDRHTIFTYKIQKTNPGEGYHLWHSEHGNREFSVRVGVYILYLNDVEEGGETEFLYLSKRINPKKGRLLIFPPNYPWAHRGNPPLTGSKYIMTGWMELT